MSYRVRLTEGAVADLDRLFGFLEGKDLRAAAAARATLAKAVAFLEIFPLSCRAAQGRSGRVRLRELVVPFGKRGYVLLFEVEPQATVTVLAVRHQREDDSL
jgi:plasmid stabilization system protein ParE